MVLITIDQTHHQHAQLQPTLDQYQRQHKQKQQ